MALQIIFLPKNRILPTEFEKWGKGAYAYKGLVQTNVLPLYNLTTSSIQVPSTCGRFYTPTPVLLTKLCLCYAILYTLIFTPS